MKYIIDTSFFISLLLEDWLYYNCELISFDKQQNWLFSKLKTIS